MSELEQLRERVISAALFVAHIRQTQDYEGAEPGPYDDAQRELAHDVLSDALDKYVEYFRRFQLRGITPNGN